VANDAVSALNHPLPEPSAAAIREDAPVGFGHWYLVIVLSLTGVLASADRIALSLIVTPLKHDLGASDFQISLLLGFAFSALYSVSTIPAGHLVDIFSRKRLLVASIAIWSVMAAVCGLAQSYTQLFLGRMGLGIGEGGSGPASVSMIRDAFPRERRGKAFAIYHATPLIGGGAALLLGGVLLGIAARGGFAGVPLFGSLRPWQVVLIVHALLGIPVLLLFLGLREPRRRAYDAERASPSFGEALRFMTTNKEVFLPLWIGVILLMAAQGGVSGWLPTVLHRAYGIPVPTVGRLLGPIQMVVVPIGGFAIGALIDRLAPGRKGEAPVLVTIGCVLVTSLAVLAQLFVADLRMAAVFYVIQVILYASVPMSISLVVSQVAPGHLIGKISALSGVCSMLLGFSWGPTATSLIADTFFTGPRALLDGLVTLWVVCLPLGALSYAVLAFRLREGRREVF
jgi:MFS family permease